VSGEKKVNGKQWCAKKSLTSLAKWKTLLG